MKQPLVERLSQLNALQYECIPCKSDYFALQVNKTIMDIGIMVTLLYESVPLAPELDITGQKERFWWYPGDVWSEIGKPASSKPVPLRTKKTSARHNRKY